MWNTGCNKIGNTLSVGINLLDGEDKGLAVTVPEQGTADWKSVIFPWCSSNHEVQRKAFRVANINSGKVFMYLFQDYHTDKTCWSVDLNDPWDSRSYLTNGLKSDADQEPRAALDIFIMPNRICGLAAPSENEVFKEVFNEAIAVVAAAGAVAGAIATAAVA